MHGKDALHVRAAEAAEHVFQHLQHAHQAFQGAVGQKFLHAAGRIAFQLQFAQGAGAEKQAVGRDMPFPDGVWRIHLDKALRRARLVWHALASSRITPARAPVPADGRGREPWADGLKIGRIQELRLTINRLGGKC